MRKGMMAIAGSLLLLMISASAPAFDRPCMMNDDMTGGGGMGMMGCGMGPGCGMGMMGGGMGMRGYGRGLMGSTDLYDMLDLTPEQSKKINAIVDDLRHKHLAVFGKMMDERAKMRDLFEEEKLDAKKIDAVQDAMAGLRKQQLDSRVDATNRIREILTKEQRDEVRQLMRGGGFGHGCGMGRGMGGSWMQRNMMGQ